MDKPLEIVFRHMDHSDSVEAAIEKKSRHLERFHDHIIDVRVIVSPVSPRHRKGAGYDVTIEVHVPGKKLVTSHSPEKVLHHKLRPTINNVIHAAFKTMIRQLEDDLRKRRGYVKHHDEIKQPREESLKLQGIAPIDLGERMCRWPIGDPHDPDFVFCGQDILDGTPYCATHASIAYQATRGGGALLEDSPAKRSRVFRRISY